MLRTPIFYGFIVDFLVWITAFLIGNKGLYLQNFWIALVGAGVLVGLGVFFGVVISAIAGKPKKEPLFYWIGQAVSLLGFCVLVWYFAFAPPDHDDRTDAQKNESVLADQGSNSAIRIAFDNLQQKLGGPNTFLLQTYLATEKDTVINFLRDTAYQIYFIYSPNNRENKRFIASYFVFNRDATLRGLDIDLSSDPKLKKAYMELNSSIDQLNK